VAVGKAAGIAITRQRLDKNVSLRRDVRGFLADGVQLLTVIVGIGFGVFFTVKDFSQQIDTGAVSLPGLIS
jgi:hypothetical protein